MAKDLYFRAAPMSRTVKIVSAVTSLIVAACSVIVVFALISAGIVIALLVALATFLILPVCAALMVRGYSLEGSELVIHRPFWSNRFPVSKKSKIYETRLTPRTLRLFGNGGFFAISGWYWNKELGRFRAFMTDPGNMIVIQDMDMKYAISPEDPEYFIEQFKVGR